MVLGRLGGSPPLIQERVLYPAHRSALTGRGFRAPAFIMLVLLAALFYLAPVRQRGLRIAPPLRCVGPQVVRPCLPPVGRAQLFVTHASDFPVLGPVGFLKGSELPRYWAPTLAFSHRRKRGPAASPPDAAADPTPGIIATRACASQPSLLVIETQGGLSEKSLIWGPPR